MNLRKFNKKILLFLSFVVLIGIGIVCSSDMAEAATIVTASLGDPKIRVCYNITTGAFIKSFEGDGQCGSGNGRDTLKWIGDDYAYCVNWKLEYGGKNYVKNTDWVASSQNAIMAGYIINAINIKGLSKELAYARTGATLNTLLAEYADDSGSYNYMADSEVSGYINAAKSYYNTTKRTNNLPSITLTSDGSSLSYNETTGKYFSGKVTATGFVANYGGSNDTTTYVISATTSSGKTVDICTDANGASCKSGSVTLTGQSNNYSFYLFISKDNVSAGESITVKVNGSNKSTYYSSILYNNVNANTNLVAGNKQKLLVISEISYARTVSKSIFLEVPDLVNHRIHAYKVDENGDTLDGATLEIYKDSVTGDPIATNNGSGYDVTYITPTVTEGEDDFFNHDYWLIEKKAPSGYIINSEPIKVYEKGTGSETGLSCYNDSMELVDEEYCYPERYEYMCQNPTTGELVSVNESGNCTFNDTGDAEQNGSEDVVTPIETDDTVDTNGTGDVVEPTVAYKKVCYNKDEEKISEVDYCSNKGSYTKVWNGNYINIKKPNTKNVVNISKKAVTGDEEIVGASLKVCTASDYESQKEDCTPAMTVDNVEMSWVSDEVAHSIYGLPVGSYFIVEVTPPDGYIRATIATEFSINEKGEVTSGSKTFTYDDFVKEEAAIVIENEITEITISKQDIATSKELPGATLSICRTYLDENNEIQMLVDQYTGDCIEAVLADGTTASWVSTNSAKKIKGLSTGTYYLVEKIAPTDYSTAESIMFTLKSDGTLVDKDGKDLSDNKIVMKDKEIEQVKTGSLAIYMVVGGVVVVVGLGVGSYYYLNKSKKNNVCKKKKIRCRKIHKL